jgi:hypothetical protein
LPLAQLARVEFSSAPTEIRRYNRERSVTINADVQTGYNTDRVTKAVIAAARPDELAARYSYVPGGELETRTESFGSLQSALIIALLGIVAILVLEFGNFKSTLIVLTVVPFGIAGGILLLTLTGNTISFTAVIGFIALIGIETKNSILLVDFTNRLRADGVPLDEAIERAGEVRFLPILLTSATAVGGLLPLALQNSAMYSPLAWVIIGGLLSSTFIARIVTPAIYKLLPARDRSRPDSPPCPPRSTHGGRFFQLSRNDRDLPVALQDRVTDLVHASRARSSRARRPARRPRRHAPSYMRSLSGLPSGTMTSGMSSSSRSNHASAASTATSGCSARSASPRRSRC